MKRRQFLQASLLALAAPAALAQTAWPQQAVRLIVPFPPGGGTDTVSRLLAEKLTTLTKWNVIVDNRPGAAGNIGLDAVAKSAADGYTLGMAQTSNLAINPALYSKMLFDALTDFQAIGEVCAQPVVLVVREDSPFKTLADFVKLAGQQPGKYTVAQAGMGTVGHLAGEMLVRSAKIDVLQVPYKGAGPAMNDLLGNQVDTYIGSSASVMSQLQTGKIRALAVTSAQRLKALPDVPTVAEQGYPGFEATTWLGLVGPAKLPPELVKTINKELVHILAQPEVQERLIAEGNVPNPGTPQAFQKLIRDEHAKWGALIREANIKID